MGFLTSWIGKSVFLKASGWLLKSLTDGALNKVLQGVAGGDADARVRLAEAQVKAEIESRKAARDIRVATAGFWEMRLITFVIAFWFVLHLSMVAVDTMFGWYQLGGVFENCWDQGTRLVCGVKAFPAPFHDWQGAILLSFFGVYAGSKVYTGLVGVLAGWLKKKA